jgi:hypothetical protein
MKNLFVLFVFFFTISCASNTGVYWCGDHPCINKKEKEAYFKKNMVVEKRNAKKIDYKNKSEIDKLIQEAQKKEKTSIKNEKSSLKQTRLEEKQLAKKIKLEEKRRIKKEKYLEKKLKLDKKNQNKVEKKSSVKKTSVIKDELSKKSEIIPGGFSEIAEKITKKNTFKPYPDINDIPN